jgi:hypothetical protein
MAGQLPSRHRALTQQFQHLAARGISQCLEDIAHGRYLANYRNIVKTYFDH